MLNCGKLCVSCHPHFFSILLMLQPKETTVVHCGFYSENGGFRVSDVDKDYMRSCRVVVATCAFGGGDDLHQPIGMTEVSVKKV